MDLHEIVSQIKLLANDLGKTPSIVEFVANSKISKRQINKHGWNKLILMAGLEPNQNSQQKSSVTVLAKAPKILCIDIETAPIIANVWALFDQNISLSQIKTDWHLLSWAGKFLDDDKIHYADQRNLDDLTNDKIVCEKIHALLNKADIILGHNSDSFDLKKLNARFIYHDLPPLPEKQTIDTLKIARRFFKFTSNKLEYIAKFLKCTEKLTERKFHGQALWTECLRNNPEAWHEMEVYNCQDVGTTIEVFDKLKAWDHRLNFQTFTQSLQCVCGSTDFKKDGIRYTKSGAFQRYACCKCNKFHTSKENMIDKSIRKEMFK